MSSTNTRDVTAEVTAFFERYATSFNGALRRDQPASALTGLYTEHCLAAHPGGVDVGENDAKFVETLDQGFEHYRSIGTQGMVVRGVEVTPIDEFHAMARVSWRASYIRNSDRKPIDIDFDVTYLVQGLDPGDHDEWRVFAFITGDEQAEYAKHGLT